MSCWFYKNNNEVFERSLSTGPMVCATNKKKQCSRHQTLTRSTHKYLTNITLPPPSHTHTHTHTHTQTYPKVTQSWLVGDREKVSPELRFEDRQTFSMSLRERDIVPDQWKNRCTVLSTLYNCSEYGRCKCQQRSGECMIGCTALGGQTDEELCQWSNCSNLAFYSAL